MSLRETYAAFRAAERKRDPALPGSAEGRARVALCYPNRYSVGMSNLGYQAVWSQLARHPRVHCDRVFLPESEDLEELREGRGELLTLDAQWPAADANLIAFGVSFESDYLNVLTLMKLLGLSREREERAETDPVVIAGGIGPTLNPYGLTRFFDALFMGEFETVTDEFAEASHRLAMGEISKAEFLDGLKPERGWLVPGRADARAAVAQRDEDFENHPAWSEILTPHSEFPGRVLVELERGCPFSCRFCAAGYAYGNSRRHSLETMKRVVDEAFAAFGAEEAPSFGLIGGALTEYRWIVPLARYIVEERGASFSLSSLRLKKINGELLELLARCGQRTVTIAPETGSERLRKVIKKNYSDEEVLDSVRVAVEAGLHNVKLYSMIGLPTETDEDIDALISLTRRCREVMVDVARRKGIRPGSVILSTGPFVPKPGTPLERAPFCDPKVLEQRFKKLEQALRREPNTTLRTEPVRNAYLETFLSRLSEADAPLLLQFHDLLWDGQSLRRAMKLLKAEIDARVFADYGEGLPWHAAQSDKERDVLEREWRAARAGQVSINAPGL